MQGRMMYVLVMRKGKGKGKGNTSVCALDYVPI